MTDHTPNEQAAAAFLEGEGNEIAAIVLNSISAAAEREGRDLSFAELCGAGIEPLIAGAWSLAKLAGPDEAQARGCFVDFLRRFADNIEALPPA